MARRVVYFDDFDDKQVKSEDDLQDLQIVIGDTRYAMKTSKTNLNKFKTAVKAYVERAQALHDDKDVEGQFVFDRGAELSELEDLREENQKLRAELESASSRPARSRMTAATRTPRASTGANTSETTKEIESLVDGKYWHEAVDGIEPKVGDAVERQFKGMKSFVAAMGVAVPEGRGAVPSDLVLQAFKTAVERGVIAEDKPDA